MIGWERRVLLRHYLEQGMTKTELAERFGIRRQQLPHAQAQRPFQDPTLASCGAEPFTPQEKESKSKGEVDELEARHLRRV